MQPSNELLILLVFIASSSAAEHDEKCPGFCGRVFLQHVNGTPRFSGCQACPWGWRVAPEGLSSKCERCTSFLPLYDWLFLLFIALLPPLTHSFFVRYYSRTDCDVGSELWEHACCILECSVASICAVMVMPPRGSFRLLGCQKSSMYEWYPALHNPQVDFGRTLPCSYELVYPLYSLPFVYFLFCLLALLIFRSLLYSTLRRKDRNRQAYYAALYSLPLLAFGHALLAGFLYHTFAYVLVLWSVAANAFHLSLEGNKSFCTLIRDLLSSFRHIAFLIVNMSLLAFAIVTFVVQTGEYWAFALLVVVPVPALFFLATSGLSHPSTVSVT